MSNFFNRLMYGKSNKSDYTKKDMQNTGRVKLFFEILGVKYMQLAKLNLLLLAAMIPLLLWTWLSFATTASLPLQAQAFYQIYYALGLIPCLLILAAPLAGITYIIKNFTQDKHVWMWKDFVTHTKSNAKQAIIYTLLYGTMILISTIVLYLYSIVMQANPIIILFKGFFIVIFTLLVISAMYFFPMMVTYELKLKHLIKNSLLLTIGSLKSTLLAPLLVLAPFAILVGLSMVWNFGIAVLLFYSVFFGFAFGMYVIVSFTTAVFAKNFSPSEDAENQDESPEEAQAENDQPTQIGS